MKLISAQIFGFQSFEDSGLIGFSDGINLIVGQNNAGKSALLRSLRPQLPNDKHRTPSHWEDIRLPTPAVKLIIDISGLELQTATLNGGNHYIPIPENVDVDFYMSNLFAEASIKINVEFKPGIVPTSNYPGHGKFDFEPFTTAFAAEVISRDGNLIISSANTQMDSTASLVSDIWQQKSFFFAAERMNIGRSTIEINTRLTSNAANLPSVLFGLSGDRGDLFRKLIGHIREIFPTVGNISVRPVSESQVEVRIWPTETMERVELSFPLLQSGTGVAQVISILAAVMTIDNAVIVIDEINSFLHPAAVKALLRVIQTEYDQHQYIISTHAPDVIGFSNPRTIHLVKREGYKSNVVKLNLDEIDAFREVAEHLGVSMADVFAADRVIWVEGPTEELCFPVLYKYKTKTPLPRGTIFTAVVATGDFMTKRRDKELVYQIYLRLSKVSVPLIVKVAFSFDGENLNTSEKNAMIRDSGGTMNFLPRRHIECYLIEPRSIADFINNHDKYNNVNVTPNDVKIKLETLAASRNYIIQEWDGNLSTIAWSSKVDAANLIADTCSELSEHRVTFNKKGDTLEIMQYINEHAPDHLIELSEYIVQLVEKVK